jgi:hypothetical protein
LDIFKNNDYKVDSLKQNFANKIGRKRVKLNLEKAITKNFFDTGNIFDAIINNNSNNNTLSSNNKNVHFQLQNQDATVRDVKETQQQQHKEKPVVTPVMFKIVNKLKKAKDPQFKNDFKETKTTITKTTTTVEPKAAVAIPVSSPKLEMAINRSSKDKPDAKLVKQAGVDEGFTERITEV